MPGNFYTLKNPFWKTYQKMYCQQKKSRIQEKKTWILGNTGINQGTQWQETPGDSPAASHMEAGQGRPEDMQEDATSELYDSDPRSAWWQGMTLERKKESNPSENCRKQKGGQTYTHSMIPVWTILKHGLTECQTECRLSTTSMRDILLQRQTLGPKSMLSHPVNPTSQGKAQTNFRHRYAHCQWIVFHPALLGATAKKWVALKDHKF